MPESGGIGVSRHRERARRGSREREDRQSARRVIVAAAERHRRMTAKPYSLRRINDAVFMVRRRGLVPDATLRRAGFNPRKRSPKVAPGPERSSPPERQGRGALRRRKAAA